MSWQHVALTIVVMLVLLARALVLAGSLLGNLRSSDRYAFTLTVLAFWIWDDSKMLYHARPFKDRKPTDTYVGWRGNPMS